MKKFMEIVSDDNHQLDDTIEQTIETLVDDDKVLARDIIDIVYAQSGIREDQLMHSLISIHHVELSTIKVMINFVVNNFNYITQKNDDTLHWGIEHDKPIKDDMIEQTIIQLKQRGPFNINDIIYVSETLGASYDEAKNIAAKILSNYEDDMERIGDDGYRFINTDATSSMSFLKKLSSKFKR